MCGRPKKTRRERRREEERGDSEGLERTRTHDRGILARRSRRVTDAFHTHVTYKSRITPAEEFPWCGTAETRGRLLYESMHATHLRVDC